MVTRTSSSTATRGERRPSHGVQRRAHPTSADEADHRPVAEDQRHGRGGRVLFEIPFRSAMSGSDLARLGRVLDLTTHMQPKMRPDPTSPGVARLDHFSGLCLERGAREGDWVLEGRTWGDPAPATVEEWRLVAAWSARQLDPTVQLWRRPATSPVAAGA